MLPHAELIFSAYNSHNRLKKSSKSIDHILRQREVKKGKMLPAAGRNAIEKTL